MTDIPARKQSAAERTRQFVPDMTVGAALALHPATKWVFASYHIGGCSHCAMSEEETLEQVAAGYELPLDKLLRDLNSLLVS
ncbi:MAG TPA: disulfide oxidoreductase [Thermoanaerobaculia bacterium]